MRGLSPFLKLPSYDTYVPLPLDSRDQTLCLKLIVAQCAPSAWNTQTSSADMFSDGNLSIILNHSAGD